MEHIAIWLDENREKHGVIIDAIVPNRARTGGLIMLYHTTVCIQYPQMPLATLTTAQLDELRALENAIYEEGVDGGIPTALAIDKLHQRENELGVFDVNAKPPRWQK